MSFLNGVCYRGVPLELIKAAFSIVYNWDRENCLLHRVAGLFS